jgi:serine/threonine-protein kinase RsbW
MSEKKTITLTILSKLEYVELIGSSINSLCVFFNCDTLIAYDIEQCCVEALNNCIEHSYKYDPNNNIEVVFSFHNNIIELDIMDNGIALESLKKDKSIEFDPEDIDNLPEGGMGLILINQIMDTVSYKSENGFNTLTMIKKVS